MVKTSPKDVLKLARIIAAAEEAKSKVDGIERAYEESETDELHEIQLEASSLLNIVIDTAVELMR